MSKFLKNFKGNDAVAVQADYSQDYSAMVTGIEFPGNELFRIISISTKVEFVFNAHVFYASPLTYVTEIAFNNGNYNSGNSDMQDSTATVVNKDRKVYGEWVPGILIPKIDYINVRVPQMVLLDVPWIAVGDLVEMNAYIALEVEKKDYGT